MKLALSHKETIAGGGLCLICLLVAPFAFAAEGTPAPEPPGAEKSTKTEALEAGAKVLQTDDPVEGMDIYLVGFHPMKDHPDHQMEAHHFCRQVNADFAQCALFDGNQASANLNGIEYIISEKLFDSLPEEEKRYWHPHNYEILSGQLIAPGVPAIAEMELMKGKMNSYGKTWHVWNTGAMGERADALPLGQPMLAWSFNRDGEAKPELVEHRDRKLDTNTSEVRERRRELTALAKPQRGVDAMKDAFAGPTESVPGVIDASASADDTEDPNAEADSDAGTEQLDE